MFFETPSKSPPREVSISFMFSCGAAFAIALSRRLDAAPGRGGMPPHVLVVEDNVGAAEALAEILEAEGYAVALASNGLLALAKIETHTFDVIISDLRMPELDGPSFYREIERWQPAPRSRPNTATSFVRLTSPSSRNPSTKLTYCKLSGGCFQNSAEKGRATR